MATKTKRPGRPKLSSDDNRTVCFRIPEGLYKRLEQHAQAQRRGVSDMIRIIVEDSVKKPRT